jgi:hypothetical protein
MLLLLLLLLDDMVCHWGVLKNTILDVAQAVDPALIVLRLTSRVVIVLLWVTHDVQVWVIVAGF